MGLPYPGGPQIDKLAQKGDPMAIDFPRALQEKGNYEFSDVADLNTDESWIVWCNVSDDKVKEKLESRASSVGLIGNTSAAKSGDKFVKTDTHFGLLIR